VSRRASGRAVPAAERMRRWRARRRAWVARSDQSPPPPLERRLHEARTLALCVMVVAKIERDPALLDTVYRNFERWEARDREAPGSAIRAWRRVLRLPWPRIAERLTVQSSEGVALRSTAPLFGLLTARERRRILRAFSRPASATR
jgi:hypothetical protein